MSAGKAPVRLPGITDTEDKFQRAVREAVRRLDDQTLRRTYVRGVALNSITTIKVPHQLGRIPLGWQISDISVNATVWRDPAIPMTNDIIPLKASATATVDLVFW